MPRLEPHPRVAAASADQGRFSTRRQLKYLSARLFDTQEAERRRVANEIHDGVGQLLTAIKLDAERVVGLVDRGEVTALATRIAALARQAAEEVRRLQLDLHPRALDDLGIGTTLSWLLDELQRKYPRLRIERSIRVDEGGLPVLVKTAIFRVVQEALLSVVQPRGATTVRVALSQSADALELAIDDDGPPLDVEWPMAETPVALAIASVRERSELSGGTFALLPVTGRGASLRLSWPWSPELPAVP